MITITRIGNCEHHNVPRFRVDSQKYGTMTLHLDGDGAMRLHTQYEGGHEYLTLNGVEYRCHVTLRTSENHFKRNADPGVQPDPGFNPAAPQDQVYEKRDFRDVDGTRKTWTDYGRAKLSHAARIRLIDFAEQAAEIVVRTHPSALFDAEVSHVERLIEDAEKAERAAGQACAAAREKADAEAQRLLGLEDLRIDLLDRLEAATQAVTS